MRERPDKSIAEEIFSGDKTVRKIQSGKATVKKSSHALKDLCLRSY